MHVWTQAEFLQLILACRERFGDRFEIEASARQVIEFMVVLRKHGPYPPARPVVEAAAVPPPSVPVAPAPSRPSVALARRVARGVARRIGVLVRRPTR
jgi:hypothetical protein